MSSQLEKPDMLMLSYVSGYRKAEPVEAQIEMLREWDKRVGWGRPVDWGLNGQQQRMISHSLPEGAEGYFAHVFDPSMIADHETEEVDYRSPLRRAFQMLHVQRLHAGGRLLIRCKEEEFMPDRYRRSKLSAERMRLLWELQGCPGGVILIPAQLGYRFVDRSIEFARKDMEESWRKSGFREIPLEAYDLAGMLLTHPIRLSHQEDLSLDCAGTEHRPGKSEAFTCAPFFTQIGNFLVFSTDTVKGIVVNRIHGSGSGFVPAAVP